MTAYVVRRILGLVPVLLGMSLLVFTLVHLIPGDPAIVMLGERATPASIARLQEQLNLNRPLFFNMGAFTRSGNPAALVDSQFFAFLGSIVRGNLGTSIFTRVDVATELAARFPATFELAVGGMVVALLIGIPAGVLAAVRKNSTVDVAVTTASLIGVAIPIFWLGMLFIYVFAVNLGWLPPSGRTAAGVNVDRITGFLILDSILQGHWTAAWDALRHLVLPAVALGTIPTATVARMTRGAMLEVLNQDYIRTARAKGLMDRAVTWRHAIKNAMLPVITVIGLSFGSLLTGAILTETIFNWPGMGKWIYDAIGARDYPIVQGGTLLIATLYVLVNTLVDISYAFFDPRIRYD
ncbi:ABC transporter permease [Limnochorda pilosa]|uniref:Peptide ABC transporter permease n=1 Tax=Limnochorda pilosa TaxID=1555112 RepID=A0A0K2SII9_LIMPI|nr:ABC transporter permease [Limnochorda pilosa]BAS26905.1 peptide ABC transporter permease [Limnochorda pilosa]